MKPVNFTDINHSFEIQAENFESTELNFTKEGYLNYTLSCVVPHKQDIILEIAAGTCALRPFFCPVSTHGCMSGRNTSHADGWKRKSRQQPHE